MTRGVRLLAAGGWAVFGWSLYLFDCARPAPDARAPEWFGTATTLRWDEALVRLSLWWMLAAFSVGTVAFMTEMTSRRARDRLGLSSAVLSVGSVVALVCYGAAIR
jgi:hypothetical protein